MNTKTNLGTQLLTCIINIFMAVSLNSFVSEELYLPMMFLYFLSGLGSSIEKISSCNCEKLKLEKSISLIVGFFCLINVCIYLMNSLGFIVIDFQYDAKTYYILLHGIPNAFFTFNSIDITPFLMISISIVPFAYFVFLIISVLRDKNINKQKISIILHSPKVISGIIFGSIASGVLGFSICYLKFRYKNPKYGTPQYIKYTILFFLLGACIFTCFNLLHYYKKEDHCLK